MASVERRMLGKGINTFIRVTPRYLASTLYRTERKQSFIYRYDLTYILSK